MTDERGNTDGAGRRTDCHFFKKGVRKCTCTALKEFYNFASCINQCGACPFFKTEESYREGMKSYWI